jgi:Uncharacterized protein conserved in bacteria
MNNSALPFLPTTRREFLRRSTQGIGLLAFSRFAPSFLVQSTLAAAPAPEKDRTILVLVQLAGGNDGLNTVVPFEDADYYRLRPTLGIAKREVLPVSDTLGFHPACAALHELLRNGELGVVQNVGYPNPNRSHFRSTEIWETASDSGEFLTSGWIGRFMDNACAGAPTPEHPACVHVTGDQPQSFASEQEHSTFGLTPGVRGGGRNEGGRLLEAMLDGDDHQEGNAGFLKHTMMNALVTEKKVQRVLTGYRPETTYPDTGFAGALRSVAALIAAGFSTRVYFVSLSGFDTHGSQLPQHARLLRTLSEGLAAFQRDLKAHRLDGQVTTMTFSEFGRRPSENESGGTDHGTAAPLFVMGSRVKAGLHGSAPSLRLERNQDLTYSTDFRSVYATMLDRWLACESAAVLGGEFRGLPLFA